MNGSKGLAELFNWKREKVSQKSLLIKPVENPPVFYGFGWADANLSTDDDTSPWPNDDQQKYFLSLHPFGLYWLKTSFENSTLEVPRIMGDTLRNPRGIFGAVLNSEGGKIFIDHENYSEEQPLIVKTGAFQGERNWACVFNPRTLSQDSKPGKVFIKYFDNDGNIYIDQRNIDFGSSNGNQIFLFNTKDMKRITEIPSSPALSYPLSGATLDSNRINFKWNTSNIARYYDLQIATDENFNNLLVNISKIDSLNFNCNVPLGAKCFWHVRAVNLNGNSIWSKVWTFSTKNSISISGIISFNGKMLENVSVILTGTIDTILYTGLDGKYSFQVNPIGEYKIIPSKKGFIITPPEKTFSNLEKDQTQDFIATLLVSIKDDNGYPSIFSIYQNYPNPFNAETEIIYDIPTNSYVSIIIYNYLGSEVATLVKKEHSAGRYLISWHPNNLPSGIYYYKLQTEKFNDIKKMVYIR